MLLSDRMLAFLAQFFLKKISRKFCGIEKRHYLCNRNQQNVDSVAQLVEQMTLNHWVESSSLSGVTKQSLKSGCFFYFCRPQAVAYLQHASARTGLWKSVVAPRRWTYRCGTVLSMSIKWRGQPPKGGCIIIVPGWLAYLGSVAEDESTAEERLYKSRKIFLQEILHRRFRES